jgi:hypothetical protein
MIGFEAVVVWATAIIFFISSALNISGPEFVKAEFAQWKYPPWLRFAVGAVESGTAMAFLYPGFSFYGACLGLAVLVGVFFSLAKTGEWLRMMLPFMLAAICVGLIASH